MFALKEPPDPELSVPSMIICKNASKQCVAIIESARDVMAVPLHCFLLIVSLTLLRCTNAQRRFSSRVEVSVYINDIPSLDVLEEKWDRL